MSKLDELMQKYCPAGPEHKKIGDVVKYEQPSKYIVKSTDYKDDFETPVLTAGQTFILGYTNETEGIYIASKENPVIIFDDFTGAFKWVDFPFKVKSSAMKMLTTNTKDTLLRYIYHVMRNLNFTSDEHKRLWISVYSEFQIPVPPLPVQEEIVRILDKFTELKAELDAELDARRKQYAYYRNTLLSSCECKIPTLRLADVCKTITTGKLNANAMDENGLYPFFTCDANPYRINTYAFDTKAILISGNGSQVGHINYYEGKFNAYQRTYVLSDFTSVDEKYILHYLKAYLRDHIEKHSKKGSIPYITLQMLTEFKIPVPSLDIQQRIVHVLDNFDAICSDLSIGLPAEIAAREKQYNYYRDLLFNYAANGLDLSRAQQSTAEHSRAQQSRVNEIKLIQYVFGCLKVQLSDICEITIGEFVHKNKQNSNGCYPVYNGGVDNTGYYDKYNQTGNKIIISARGANAGFVNRIFTNYWAGNSCYTIGVTISLVDWNYLFYLLKNKESDLLGKQQKGSIPAISKAQVENFMVQIPPIEEQRKIVNILDRFDKLCNDISDGLPAEIKHRERQYEHYRNFLLQFERN